MLDLTTFAYPAAMLRPSSRAALLSIAAALAACDRPSDESKPNEPAQSSAPAGGKVSAGQDVKGSPTAGDEKVADEKAADVGVAGPDVTKDVVKPVAPDEPRWAKPGQKLATLSHALPPVSEGIVVHLTPRELIASDKALVEVDESGAFDSMVLEGHLVRPLFDHLAEEADRAKQEAAKTGAEWNGRLVIVADDDARFSTLVDLLYTAGRAEFSNFELVALAGGKHGAVAFVPPAVITTPEGSVASTEEVPSVFVLEDGYRVHIKGQQKGAAERADNPLRPTILLAKPGAAIADYDRWDYAKLADELGRLHTLFPDMKTVNVSAEGSIPFGALMRAIQTVRGEGCNAGGECIFAELVVSPKPTPGADSFDPDAGATDAGSAGESPDDLGLIGLGNVGLIGKGIGGAGKEGPKKPGEYGRGAGFGGRGRPVPKVRQRKASVEGAMDADIVRRIVRSHINEVRDCYELGLDKDATLSGEVTIDFTIDARGKVSSAEVAEDTLGDKEVGKCMGKALERWKFTRPKDGGSVKVSCPFVLAPG